MKRIFLGLIVLAVYSSCNKVNNLVDPTIATDLPDIVVTGPKINNNFIQANKTYNLLGYGYDVTGKYADTSAVRSSAINVAALDINNPYSVNFNGSTYSGWETINAVDAADYSSQLSNMLSETTGLNQFKGSITTPFPGQNSFSPKYIYASYSYIFRHKKIAITADYDLLKHYLTPAFIQDSQNLTPADLVKKYGTHILADISIGAKLNVTYQAETTSPTRKAALKAGFNYAMGKVFNLFTGSLDPINTTDLQTVSSPKIVYDAIGADLSKIKVNTTTSTPTVEIIDWANSSTASGAAFIGIGIKKNSLIPLHELISDPVQKTAVKTYIAGYLTSQQVKLN